MLPEFDLATLWKPQQSKPGPNRFFKIMKKKYEIKIKIKKIYTAEYSMYLQKTSLANLSFVD